MTAARCRLILSACETELLAMFSVVQLGPLAVHSRRRIWPSTPPPPGKLNKCEGAEGVSLEARFVSAWSLGE